MKFTISFLVTFCFAVITNAAPTDLVFWDFLGGGDGVRMTQIVDEFNKSQKDIQVTKSTLTWGEPFYTKVHAAVVAGETPDLMTYHLSHFAAGIASKDLRPLTTDELSLVGLKKSDFQQSLIDRSLAISKEYGKSDELFGVPLDIHTLVLYYNKTALSKSGMLEADGTPKGLDSIESFKKMLVEVKAKTHFTPIAWSTTSADPASCWRLWYTLFKQQGGDFVKDNALTFDDVNHQGSKGLQAIAEMVQQGLITIIWPVASLVLVLQLIAQFKIFDQVYLLTQGGPFNSTMVVLLYMYRQAFQQNRGGYASAVAIALVVIMMLISAIQFRFLQGKRVK